MTIDIQLVKDLSIVPGSELFGVCSFVAVGAGVVKGVVLVISEQLILLGMYVSHSEKPVRIKIRELMYYDKCKNLIINNYQF